MFKIKELRKLPHKVYNTTKEYDSLLVINSCLKHDSGYAIIYVIGVICKEPIEIACSCDEIQWNVVNVLSPYHFRTDMYYPSGILRYWSNNFKFSVGPSLSSTEITLVPL